MDVIDYDHHANLHTVKGATEALKALFGEQTPTSLLDVGCGWGTWLRAALDLGVPDVFGIDGVDIRAQDFLVPFARFRHQDLCQSWDLGRRFDIVLCLEVAEHLPAAAAPGLVATLTKHSDLILFSAAVPGQPGQHHVNCQWPEYWQGLFNREGYACDDSFRWSIWHNPDIEPWYRQNVFLARNSIEGACSEDRIRPVLHPNMIDSFVECGKEGHQSAIEAGIMAPSWYISIPFKAATAKLKRKIFGTRTML